MDRRSFGKAACVAFAGCCMGSAALAAETAPAADAFDVMKNRHSVRAYTDQSISDADIEKILRFAMQAPSAANEQAWEFIVIRDRALLDQVGGINHYASFASKAPVAILLCLNDKKVKEEGMAIIDMGTCAENMMLAATAMGIGSVFTGIYPHKDRMAGFVKLCDLPDYVQPIGLIVFGYPAIKEHQPVDRYNPQAVHHNKW